MAGSKRWLGDSRRGVGNRRLYPDCRKCERRIKIEGQRKETPNVCNNVKEKAPEGALQIAT